MRRDGAKVGSTKRKKKIMSPFLTTDAAGITFELCEMFRCPCCQGPLYVSVTGIPRPGNPVIIYCPEGPGCTVAAMNDGAASLVSVEDALEKMAATCAAELQADYDRLEAAALLREYEMHLEER